MQRRKSETNAQRIFPKQAINPDKNDGIDVIGGDGRRPEIYRGPLTKVQLDDLIQIRRG